MFKTNWKLGLGFGFCLVMGATNAHAIGTGMPLSIAVVGPQGEIISYEKNGDQITIRQCAKDTLKSEIESKQGCTAADGVADVVLKASDFKELVKTKLSTLSTKSLSAEQKKLLERYRTDAPNVDDDIQKLAEYEKQLKKKEAAKQEFPEDYDAKGEKDLRAKIQCIQDRQKDQAPVAQAKKDMAKFVDSLIAEMQTKKIKRLLKYSSDRNGIAFNLLKEIASTEDCSLEKSAKAAVGTVCKVGGFLWKIEADGTVRDLKSGKLVSKVLGKSNQYNAKSLCPAGMDLPTGYPESLNGKTFLKKDGYAFDVTYPNEDSDFVMLEKHGIRQVAPEMNTRWFWSSSVHPSYAYVAYVFDGSSGYVVNVARGNDNGSVRCVGR